MAAPETVADMLKHYDEWGGQSTYPHYPAGWAVAMDSPFTYTKQVASDFGGTRNGMVIHWPKGIKAKGEVRSQFGHVIDIAPTVYEAAKIPAPKKVNGIDQDPLEGKSLVYSFDNAGAKETHTVQYFEMFGNRAIYSDGWYARTIHRPAWQRKAVTDPRRKIRGSFTTRMRISACRTIVAASNAAKLKELQALFMTEAEKYHVLPIDDRLLERTNAELVGRPTVMEGRNTVTLRSRHERHGRRYLHRHSGQVLHDDGRCRCPGRRERRDRCQGGRFGGFSFFLNDGKPTFTYNYLGLEKFTVASSQALSPGKHTIVYEFKSDGGLGKGGIGTITIDGNKVGEGRIEKTQPGIFSVDDLADVGTDDGTPVTDYGKSRKFTGTLNKVTIETSK